MTLSKQTIIIAIILSVVLFVTGFFIRHPLFHLMLPIVNDVKYFDDDLALAFRVSIVFGLTLALIPVATVLVWKFAPIFKAGRKILTACIIVLAMLVAVIIRREVIKSQLKNLKPYILGVDKSDPDNPVEIKVDQGLTLSDVKFEYFAFVGVIAGSAISLFALREKEK